MLPTFDCSGVVEAQELIAVVASTLASPGVARTEVLVGVAGMEGRRRAGPSESGGRPEPAEGEGSTRALFRDRHRGL